MARGQNSFGLSSNRGSRGRNSVGGFRGNSRGTRGRGRARGGTAGVGRGSERNNIVPAREDDGSQLAERFERVALNDEVDEKLGFAKVDQGPRREGWLINMHTVSFSLFMSSIHGYLIKYGKTLVKDPDWPGGKAAVDYYFIQDDGGMFKCTLQYEPYFYIGCKVSFQNLSTMIKFLYYSQRPEPKRSSRNGCARNMKGSFTAS